MSFDGLDEKNEIEDDDFLDDKRELEPQSVDPKKGWGFRGVHRVSFLCGVLLSLFSHESMYVPNWIM